MSQSRWPLADLVLPAALGLLATAGFASWHFYPATLVALVILLPLWRHVGIVRAAWRGFVFGLFFFGLEGYLGHFFPGHGAGVDVTRSAFLSAALVVPWIGSMVLAGAVASMLRRLPALVWALLIVPSVWIMAVLVCEWVLGGRAGFSWGYAALDAPVRDLAPLVGVHGMALALILSAGVLWLLFSGTLTERLAALVLIAALPFLLWYIPPSAYWTQSVPKSLRVAVFPGEAASRVTADDHAIPLFARYREMTRRSETRFVVWPAIGAAGAAGWTASALNTLDVDAGRRNQTVLAALSLGDGRNDLHVFGSNRSWPVPCGHACNVDDSGVDAVASAANQDPLAAANQPVMARAIRAHGLVVGLVSGVVGLPHSLFADVARSASVLVAIPGKARDTSAPALIRPLRVARARALETGRPLLVASGGSGSALVAYDGKILYRIPADRNLRLVADVTPRHGLTPYVRYGDAPLYLGAVIVVLMGFVCAFMLRRKQSGR